MSARNELLPIDTGFTFKVNDELSDGDFYGVPNTSTRLSTAVSIPEGPSSSLDHSVRPSTNIHARNEARKLVSHVLLQLANRRKPPPVLDAIVYTTRTREEPSLGVLPQTLKEVVKGIKPETKSDGISLPQEDISVDEQLSFSTDDTINLVIQLEDVLATSIAQGWQIFDQRLVVELCRLKPTKRTVVLRYTTICLRTGLSLAPDFHETVVKLPQNGHVRRHQIRAIFVCQNCCRSAYMFLRPSFWKTAVIRWLHLDHLDLRIHCRL